MATATAVSVASVYYVGTPMFSHLLNPASKRTLDRQLRTMPPRISPTKLYHAQVCTRYMYEITMTTI